MNDDTGESSTYLWDRDGEPDADVARLEQLLGRYRHRAPLAPLPARAAAVRRPLLYAAMQLSVAAAALILVAAAAWMAFSIRPAGWTVQSLAGAPAVAGAPIDGPARVPVGETVVTDGGSRARIDVSTIGYVDVEPNSRVRLLASRAREHRLALDHGEIRARIWAPPKLFFVNTPSSTAIDLGCAYTLRVDDKGWGRVVVESGWVAFEHQGRESFIPQGAICQTRPGAGPGTPCYSDAAPALEAALTILDFSATDDVRRAAALDSVLARARSKDAFTLWHLLTRGRPDERLRVYDRLASLVPPPEGVTRDAVLARDSRALDAWWNELGLDTMTWWKLWKRKW